MYFTLYYIVTRLPDSLCVDKDHFLEVCPTTLTTDLLEKSLLAAKKSIVAVGASRGDPRTPVFESRSALRLPLARNAAREARALEGLAGAVEVVVEAVEGLAVVVGVVARVAAAAVALKAEEAAVVAEGAEAAEVAEEAEVKEVVEAAAVAVVERVATLRKGVGQRGGGTGPCTYVLRTCDLTGEQWAGLHSTQRCFDRLTDAWHLQFPEASDIPRWGDLSRAGVAIFDLDYDAILAAMYAVTTSV
ncbi:unnamed protein product [Closterium sp. NIES-65]|nr:unnamed protein product [Closterium sp. NIES-65]